MRNSIMTRKQVDINPRPKASTSSDAWINKRLTEDGSLSKRLTVDVPADLHVRVKAGCALRNTNMRSIIIDLLDKEFPA